MSDKTRRAIIIDHGRHDMYEILFEYGKNPIENVIFSGCTLVQVIQYLLREFVDEDYRKTKRMMEILGVKEKTE